MADAPFLVRIWGARGSAPAPVDGNIDYGTDTCCIEMRCGDRILVFDAGSGATSLGLALLDEGVTDFDIFFTHCHFDHIMGLPFMKSLYAERNSVRMYAGHFEDGTTCQEMVENFIKPPYFPLTPKFFRASIEYLDFRPPQVLEIGDGITISTVRLNHPNGAVGYRVDFDGRSVSYITDTEHQPGTLDGAILDIIRGSDIVIYDCMFTDDELAPCTGYGHSTWEQGVRLCQAAGVERLVIFHHRPGRDDAALHAIEAEAQALLPGAVIAGTGLELVP
jgi:phosphoribosyl 1,2-cyclic phosphodiesterase